MKINYLPVSATTVTPCSRLQVLQGSIYSDTIHIKLKTFCYRNSVFRPPCNKFTRNTT